VNTPEFEKLGALVADLGFLLDRDLPSGERDALLVLALRESPTRLHFDPELVEYWAADETGRGRRSELTFATGMPLRRTFSWGSIEVVDRFGVSNSFVSLGGVLEARRLDAGSAVAAFSSPGPILRRGGHSQAYDQFAAELTAFFARMMVPIDFMPGAEALISNADPADRYAMFLQHELTRLGANEQVRNAYGADARLVRAEALRLVQHRADAWAAGAGLLDALGLARDRLRTVSPSSATG
jgi:hypothetical protein